MEHPLLPRVFLTGNGLETASYTARGGTFQFRFKLLERYPGPEEFGGDH